MTLFSLDPPTRRALTQQKHQNRFNVFSTFALKLVCTSVSNARVCVCVFMCLSCQNPSRKIKWLQKSNLTANPNTIHQFKFVYNSMNFDSYQSCSFFPSLFLSLHFPSRFFHIDATEVIRRLTSEHAIDRSTMLYSLFLLQRKQKNMERKKGNDIPMLDGN